MSNQQTTSANVFRIDAISSFPATIGADFLTKEVVVDDRVVTMQVWCQVVLLLSNCVCVCIVTMTNTGFVSFSLSFFPSFFITFSSM